MTSFDSKSSYSNTRFATWTTDVYRLNNGCKQHIQDPWNIYNINLTITITYDKTITDK